MRFVRVTVYVSIVLVASVLPTSLGAHHSFALEFDTTKPVALTGVITKIEWANPHGRLFVDVKESTGAVATPRASAR